MAKRDTCPVSAATANEARSLRRELARGMLLSVKAECHRGAGSLAGARTAGNRGLTGAEVKTRLREQQGMTLKQWAAQHGYPYETVSDVVRGINRGTYGMGHRIAVALQMKSGG